MSKINKVIDDRTGKGCNLIAKTGNFSNVSDICRMVGVNYTKTGGRRMDKPKLNFRFHGPDSSEALTRALLRICIDANRKKVENVMREEAALALDESDKKREDNHDIS